MGGAGLLRLHKNSPMLVLSTVYPEYEYVPWKFEHIPRNSLSDISSKRKFMDWAGKELGIKQYSDWYSVSAKVKKEGCFVFFTSERI